VPISGYECDDKAAFQLLGCITFAWGFFILFWMPDSPMHAKCFSLEDRLLMAERVRKNETGIQNKTFKVLVPVLSSSKNH
jgi:hypothetical protein